MSDPETTEPEVIPKPEEPKPVEVKPIPKSLHKKGKRTDQEIHDKRLEALKKRIPSVLKKLERDYNEDGYPMLTKEELLEETDSPTSVKWLFCANRAILQSQSG